MAKDFDLTPVHTEFLKYAPAYAMKEAAEAIQRAEELHNSGLIRNGVYYIVLTDIVGSTEATAKLGNREVAERIQYFVTSSINALSEDTFANIRIFLKEIGDAVLFVFAHFPDVLRWHHHLLQRLDLMNQTAWKKMPMRIRTVIHLGELYLDGVNPVALAVSQAFKMEKLADPDEVMLSASAYHAAWPSIARAYHAFEERGAVEIEGHEGTMPVYRLRTFGGTSSLDLANEKLD